MTKKSCAIESRGRKRERRTSRKKQLRKEGHMMRNKGEI
jgi:hypothetical protein